MSGFAFAIAAWRTAEACSGFFTSSIAPASTRLASTRSSMRPCIRCEARSIRERSARARVRSTSGSPRSSRRRPALIANVFSGLRRSCAALARRTSRRRVAAFSSARARAASPAISSRSVRTVATGTGALPSAPAISATASATSSSEVAARSFAVVSPFAILVHVPPAAAGAKSPDSTGRRGEDAPRPLRSPGQLAKSSAPVRAKSPRAQSRSEPTSPRRSAKRMSAG